MCTVSFLPTPAGILLTSNRDEKGIRQKAIPPKQYRYETHTLLYPKDAQAGGTWIAVSDTGTIMVLLNGGFIKHQPLATYRKSRGLIFLDILAERSTALSAFQRIHLLGIEPFTLIIWEKDSLHECRWSGEEKYIRTLNHQEPHIWSSVTLYNPEIIQKREKWFSEWLLNNQEKHVANITQFHLFGGEGDQENDIRMNRNNELFTVSVTAIEADKNAATMHYHDLQSQQTYHQTISFVQEQAVS